MRTLARTTFALAAIAVAIGCEKEPARNPPPATLQPAQPAQPAAPAPAAAAPANDAGASKKPKMVANPDGLSLADRIAKRQAEEKKVAEQLAMEEKQRLIAYDKKRLPLHQQVFASIKKVRAAYGKANSKEDVEKIRAQQEKVIAATGKKMATIDAKGGNSNVTTDYDVMLNALANDYPDALEQSFGGDRHALDEQNAELDKRSKKIEGWLAELKSAKK